MEAARANLLGSLNLGGQKISSTRKKADATQAQEEIPSNHLMINLEILSRKVTLIAPDSSIVADFKKQILDEIFGPQQVLVPPSIDNLHLFGASNNSNGTIAASKKKSNPTNFQWEGPERRFAVKTNGEELGPEILPHYSFLVKDDGVVSNATLIFRFDILVQIHITPPTRPIDASDKANDFETTTINGKEEHGNVLKIPVVNDQISTLKQGIQALTGWSLPCLHVFWQDRELEDYIRIGSIKGLLSSSKGRNNDESSSSLSLLQLQIDDCVVHIRTLKGECFSIGVNTSDSQLVMTLTSQVRRTLERRGKQDRPYASEKHPNIPMEDYLLILPNGTALDLDGTIITGQEADSTNTLSTMGIENDCTMYLVLKNHVETSPTSTSKRTNPCPISKAEHRGISLVQLRGIAAQILLLCQPNEWKSTNPHHHNKSLVPEEVTLYDLMNYYIKPLTQESNCSYVELIADSEQDQIPEVFCSHWWGESVLRFIACLEQHARDRGISEYAPYWVCAYAINQHDVYGELPVATPKETPFYKAMQLTKGAISVIDGAATYFHRIWCVYEISVVINDLKQDRSSEYYHDLYTVERDDERSIVQEPSGIIDHVVPCNNRVRRQETFPLQACHKALTMNLEEADATMKEDRNFILNSIISASNGADALQTNSAPTSHVAYDRLNATLRAKIAESTYGSALSKDDTELENFRQALSAAPHGQLILYLRGCQQFRNEAAILVNRLPTTLMHLELDIGFIAFQTSDEFAPGLRHLQSLENFELVASWCNDLTNIDSLCDELAHLRNLTHLELDFSCSKALSRVDGLGQTLQQLPNLRSIGISLADCEGLQSIEAFLEGLASSTNLVKCDLDFSYTQQQKATGSLGSALGNMPKLKEVSLNLEDSSLESVDSIVQGLTKAINLARVRFRLSGNRLLSSLDNFGRALQGLSRLRYLELDCSFCNAITSLDEVTNALQSCSFPLMEEIKLKCVRNKFLTLSTFPVLSSMRRLSALDLDFAHCRGVTSLSALTDGFRTPGYTRQFHSLRLNFEGTSVPVEDVADLCKALVQNGIQASDIDLRFPLTQAQLLDDLKRLAGTLKSNG